MADAGAAVVVPDAELDAERLRREVETLLGEPGRLDQMGELAGQLAKPDAAERIADGVLGLTRHK
jgi:UDP-N-acetylglucosamine--N-acetylmuramyl-(pentapeptide) pyrophosphoryl-undecaprenol N-acetylglucosamine transferase